jgi:endonuclease YncB( thermonuclease family)
MSVLALRKSWYLNSRRHDPNIRDGTIFRSITLALTLCGAAFADDLIGQASVVNRDTLEIHGTRIRLWGIDAPESSQLCRNDESLQYRCGAKAANELDSFIFIARRPVDCLPKGQDRYGRTVAVCSVAGADITDWLVRNGLADVRKGQVRPRSA